MITNNTNYIPNFYFFFLLNEKRPIPDYSWALITRKSDPDCISSLLYQVAEKCSVSLLF